MSDLNFYIFDNYDHFDQMHVEFHLYTRSLFLYSGNTEKYMYVEHFGQSKYLVNLTIHLFSIIGHQTF